MIKELQLQKNRYRIITFGKYKSQIDVLVEKSRNFTQLTPSMFTSKCVGYGINPNSVVAY